MKKILLWLPIVALLSCNKNSQLKIPDQPFAALSSPLVRITNSESDLILADSTDNFLSGTYSEIQVQQVYIDPDVNDVLSQLTQTSDSTFTGSGIITSLEFVNFIPINSSQFQVDVVVNGDAETFVINSTILSIDKFKLAISTGFSHLGKTQVHPLWWLTPITVVIIKTVEITVDNCNNIVTQGIMSCTSMGKCFEAGFCSVKCMNCSS